MEGREGRKEAFEEKVEGEWEGRKDVGKEKRKMPPFNLPTA